MNQKREGAVARRLAGFVATAGLVASASATIGYDQDATPDLILGSGNANGSFTTDRAGGLELALRGKLRFNASNMAENTFNSNGDGTYDFAAGTAPSGFGFVGSPRTTPVWSFEWSINTDYDGSASGRVLSDLTYELGMDFDPGPGTDYLVWDPVTVPSTIPYVVPSTSDWYDHSMGTNATPNGGGVEATDNTSYLANLSSNNVLQQSWNYEFFNALDRDTFLPNNPGEYQIYLEAFDGVTLVGRTEITINVTVPADSLTLEVANCPDDADAAAGTQVAVELWMRNPSAPITGFFAALNYDDSILDYRADLSTYGAAFGTHISGSEPSEPSSGSLNADGNALFGGPVSGDALLATLVFDVLTECGTTDVEFDLASAFPSELSAGGTPLPTALTNSGEFYLDDTAPVIAACPMDLVLECDESTDPVDTDGLTDAGVSDNCTLPADIVIGYEDVVTPGACPNAQTITRTWTISDACGNSDSCVQTLMIDDTTAPVLVCPADVTVECDESTDPDLVNPLLADSFDVAPTLAATQTPGAWYTDRYAPAAFTSTFFDGDNRLLHSIAIADGTNNRPGGFGSTFYDTQGRKYDLPAGSTRMSVELYVPSAWATTDRRLAGFWGTAVDATDTITGYPIIEFSTDGSNPRFRWYTQDTDQDAGNGYQAGWIDLGLPTGFAYDAWYTLEIVLTGGTYIGTVGDLQIVDTFTFGSVRIDNVILQGHNTAAGVDYDIHWDTFGVYETVMATDNCDPAPVIAYSDTVAAGMCPNEEVISRTWTATDACGNVTSCTQEITVVDTTAPMITCPADVTIECDESSLPSNTGEPTVSDNCSAVGDIVVTSSDSVAAGSCPNAEIITRTWTATDECDNESMCVQTITVVDTTAPTITLCPSDITQNADAGLCTADVTWMTATATDNCGAATIEYEIDLGDDASVDATQSGTSYTFPPGTHRVTVVATDACNLVTTCDFTVTIDALNTVNVTVELFGVDNGDMRCIRFIPLPGSCTMTAVDYDLTFVDHDATPGTAVRVDAVIEIPCGSYTSMCVKDEQHTLYETVSLSVSGTDYVAGGVVTLISGDTDNDSDVDINDVTWLIAQFGGLAADGGCPYDGTTRDADFDNSGSVDSPDYVILSDAFLTFSTCPCSLPIATDGTFDAADARGDVNAIRPGRAMGPRTVLPVAELPAEIAAEADLNGDGVVDAADVMIFEDLHGLPATLSAALLKIEHEASAAPLRRP